MQRGKIAQYSNDPFSRGETGGVRQEREELTMNQSWISEPWIRAHLTMEDC